jgi:lipopolysaccharide/colanic/teichoic acid biosynthesis glycosyltransferase
MHFNAAHVWIAKVGAHCDAVAATRRILIAIIIIIIIIIIISSSIDLFFGSVVVTVVANNVDLWLHRSAPRHSRFDRHNSLQRQEPHT